MPKSRWQPLPVHAHVLIDGQVSGLVIGPLPKRAGQTYVVKTHSFTRFIHENRLTLRPESKSP